MSKSIVTIGAAALFLAATSQECQGFAPIVPRANTVLTTLNMAEESATDSVSAPAEGDDIPKDKVEIGLEIAESLGRGSAKVRDRRNGLLAGHPMCKKIVSHDNTPSSFLCNPM